MAQRARRTVYDHSRILTSSATFCSKLSRNTLVVTGIIYKMIMDYFLNIHLIVFHRDEAM